MSMAFDFLGAGVGGARIFLYSIHFTLTNSHTHWSSSALTKMSTHCTHTRTNSLFTVGAVGAGEYGCYISLGLPLGDLWDGGGGSISRPVRKCTPFCKFQGSALYISLYPRYTLPKWLKSSWISVRKMKKKPGFSHVHSDFISPSSGDQL